MKKIIVLAIGAIICFSSCDDFLNINPRTQVSEEEFYKTEEEVMMGLYALMNEVQNGLMEVHGYTTYLSDEAETGGGLGEGVYKFKYDNFTYDPTTSPPWWNEWSYGIYNGVTTSNILVDKVNKSGLSDAFVKSIDAEARFYRALFYCYLFMGYEQFPLFKEPIPTSEIYNVTKSTREEIFEFMMSDLDNGVIQYLPDKASTQRGRINKDAARVLKAKLILFHRAESKYSEALELLREIINSGRYSLASDYTKIWLKEGEYGPESIYEVAFAGNNSGEGNPLGRSLGGRAINDPRSAEQGGLYEGYGQSTIPLTMWNMFKPGDTRREGTIINYKDEIQKVRDMVNAGILQQGDTFIVSEKQEDFVWLGHYKYHPRKEHTSQPSPLNNFDISFKFYRYSDVLLLATELQARISGSVNAEAQGWFNQVRDRAFQNQNNRIDLTSKNVTEILNIIFEERGFEFMHEMQRWFDIMRFDKGTEILGSKGWTERYRYFPIAQKEMDKSQGSLTQNPGWLN